MDHRFATNLWTFPQKQKFLGLEVGTRMTVVDLSGQGDLWIHSPIKLTQTLQDQLMKIGTVRYIIAPNKYHHLYINDYLIAFPQAELYIAPGLEQKRTDLSKATIIKDGEDYTWALPLDFIVCHGIPIFNEVVFLHKESETLIVTDIGLHICEDSPFLTRLLFKLMGGYKKFGISKIEKKIFIKDTERFNQSLHRILDWEFDKIVMAHGRPIKSNGKELFRKAYL